MLTKIKGKLVVSCQALENEPLYGSLIMGKMALAAKMAGACAIRAQGVKDIEEIKRNVDLPIIGIIKREYPDSKVYITATKKEVLELVAAKVDMIALDATDRIRPNGETLKELIDLIHSHNILVMADCSKLEDAINAERLGADCVSSTLAGYTDDTFKTEGPDLKLLKEMIKNVNIPIIAEGRIHYPTQLKEVFDLGVHSAVVGGAITRPLEIAKRFISVIEGELDV